MAKQKKPVVVAVSDAADSEALKEQLLPIALRVKSKGFVPETDLASEFGDQAVTVFGAIFYSDWRIVVRETKKWGTSGGSAIGFRWSDRRFSKSEQKKIPEALNWMVELCPPQLPRYTDFLYTEIRCQWTNHVLAALPITGESEKRVFERANGHIVIPAHCVRSMWRKTMPVIDKPMTLADQHMKHAPVLVPAPETITIKPMPVVDEKTKQGRGLTMHESLPPGTPFTLRCYYPSSQLKPDELLSALAIAGQFVRLSPARSSGYGDFEVLGE